jgi:hypothetical protein
MFNGIWLVASEPLTVRAQEIQAGEVFQCPRILAGAYLVMRRASLAPKSSIPDTSVAAAPRRRRGRPRKTETADLVSEASEDAVKPKRHYRRRDLEADES